MNLQKQKSLTVQLTMLKEAVIFILTLISLSHQFLDLSSFNTSNPEKSFDDILGLLGWIEENVEGEPTENPLNHSSEENSDEFLEWEGDEAEWLTTSPPAAGHVRPKFESIISGQDIDIGAYPWHVGIVRVMPGAGVFIRSTTFCGGTLINPGWVLTAAHCVKDYDTKDSIKAVLGSSRRARFFYYRWQCKSLRQIVIHPQWNKDTVDYDFALLQLRDIAKLEPNEVWPICLPTQYVESYQRQNATVVGWGNRPNRRWWERKKQLQELRVRIMPQILCGQIWRRIEVGDPQVCFTSHGSACHGDSGGGMYLTHGQGGEEYKELIGVCSYGRSDCSNEDPEVYAKVSSVLDWIKETVGVSKLNMERCGITHPRDRDTETWRDRVRDWLKGRQAY